MEVLNCREGTSSLKTAFNLYGLLGFALVCYFAVTQAWSLPAFCWGTWLAGLLYTWGCIVTGAIQIILFARSDRVAYEERLPFVRRLPPLAYLFGIVVLSVCGGIVAFRVYSFLFGFYGLFLSVFAEMEPLVFFGRNGFINSDFFSPVLYLLERFWPVAVGVLLANGEDFFGRLTNPWRRMALPFQREILRLHVMILALPFVTMLSWALFKGAYQTVTIVILMGLLFLLSRKRAANAANPVTIS
ncbi:MAG TPA: hypothetical protein PK022_03705 [Syntrophales bacterium]|nr:hypothetical protein [Syntrophales bacterium]